ncbi:hypothetical protein UFOVP758_29 [uncultured Caudovirales phage]|uniref:Uncharacterized protein n=1 Tax=uncultured Caudovirales phage TaxID=2100421 RepID=A0A6J7X8D6_9CAUD|nr:hypothetical protein UFOVP758_29 [uncultured Caudovirales phage]
MRQAIYDHIDSISKGSFSLTNELPWDSSGQTLYLKNLKRIYVNTDQVQEELLYAALNGLCINNEITTVTVYFACDAKQLPSNYETLVSAIRLAKNSTDITGVTRRECDVTTSFEADVLVTEFEFRFINVIN